MSTPASTHANEQTRERFAKVSTLRSLVQMQERAAAK
jgi:hypothetical protein